MNEFLALCGVSQDEFLASSVLDRATIVEKFLNTRQTPNDAIGPTPRVTPSHDQTPLGVDLRQTCSNTIQTPTAHQTPMSNRTSLDATTAVYNAMVPVSTPLGVGVRPRSSCQSFPLSPPASFLTPRMIRDCIDTTTTSPDARYETLCQTQLFKSIAKEVKVEKLKRMRTRLDQKRLSSPCLESLNSEEMMWLQRLHVFTATATEESDEENETDDDDDEPVYSMEEIVSKVLSSETIKRFHTHVKTSSEQLSATTYRKGFYSLRSVLWKICGKSLSRVAKSLRSTVQEALDTLLDIARTYNNGANLALCQAEVNRLELVEQSAPAAEVLARLYYLFVVKREWFLAQFAGDNPSRLSITIGCGYTVLAMLLGRPVSRGQVLRLIRCDSLVGKLSFGAPLSLLLAEHKTMSTYGALVCVFPTFTTEILCIYQKHLRPALIRQQSWGKGSKQLLFSQNLFHHLQEFFQDCGIQLNASSLRRLFSTAIGAIRPDSAWAPFKRDLESCCAHQTQSTKVVERHYQLTSKFDREHLLQRYIHTVFYEPACLRLTYDMQQSFSFEEHVNKNQHLMTNSSSSLPPTSSGYSLSSMWEQPCTNSSASSDVVLPAMLGQPTINDLPISSGSAPIIVDCLEGESSSKKRNRMSEEVEMPPECIVSLPTTQEQPCSNSSTSSARTGVEQLTVAEQVTEISTGSAEGASSSKKRNRMPEEVERPTERMQIPHDVLAFVSLSPEFKLTLKLDLTDAFRLNFFLGDNELSTVVRSSTRQMFPNYFKFEENFDTVQYLNISKSAVMYAKGLLKNWVNKV
jgi:hypothetical protein